MKQRESFFLILVLLSCILLIPGLGETPLWIYDEVRNAECAREMYENNNWIVPTFNGELRTLKPPLHYYFMFAGFKIFGISEWGARFFSTLAGVLAILVLYVFVKKYISKLIAFISCLILLSSSHFLFQFRMSVPDPYLILFNTISLFCSFVFFQEKKMYYLFVAAIAFGLGILAKGPVAILLPALSIFLWLCWERKLKEIFSLKILAAAIVMFAVAAPWYFLVHQATKGAWTKGFFIENNLERFSSPMEGHGGLFIIIPIFILMGLLPASIFISEAVKNFKQRFDNSLLKLSICVVAVFTVFYCISGTKLPNYPMPCYPFVAIILGSFIASVWRNNKNIKRYPFVILAIINIAFPIAAYFGIKNETATIGLQNTAFVFLILSVGAILALVFSIQKNFKKAIVVLFCSYFFFNLLLLHWAYPKIYKQNPMTKTIEVLKKQDKIVAYQIFHPSFTYYLPKRIPVFYSIGSLKKFLSTNKAAIISRENFAEELKAIQLTKIASEHDLFENSTTVIFSNN